MLLNLAVTDEPRYVNRRAKTFEFQVFQLPEIFAISGFPGGTRNPSKDK